MTSAKHAAIISPPDRADGPGAECDPDERESVARESAEHLLIAYRVFGARTLPIVPATATRQWMDETDEHKAKRCLPLLIAGQSGWCILNTHRVIAVWNGGNEAPDLHVAYHPKQPDYSFHLVRSLFGQGILTWTIPYLFRTPPGYNLLVRGPANWPKDGASALEGVVETDWSDATFSMSWKLTRPKISVVFEVGEPICMIVPQRRGELESFQPEIRDVESDPAIHHELQEWSASRYRFKAEVELPGSAASRQRWQRHYVQGVTVTGRRAPEHQTKLKLRRFTDSKGAGNGAG